MPNTPVKQNGQDRRRRRGAFTLVELMVAIAIIAILIAIALPAFNSVRKQALVTATSAFFTAMSTGNDVHRADQAIGGSYIPSRTDSELQLGANSFSVIDNPMAQNGVGGGPPGSLVGPITGASLLVYGLAGADQLGTPGFRSMADNLDSNFWYEDFGTWQAGTTPDLQGLHYLDPAQNMQPAHPRYGPYIDSKGLEKIRTFQQLVTEGIITTPDPDMVADPNLMAQATFVDAWDRPILYYRAQRSANLMVTNPGPPVAVGVYDLRDNMQLTGNEKLTVTGTDFGAGPYPQNTAVAHSIGLTAYPVSDPSIPAGDLTNVTFQDHFEQFIWDRGVTQRNVPVKRESFLLISAGPDGRYGTADDVTNWTRDR